MLKRETFVMAINKIQKHQALMDQLHQTLREFGDFPLNLDFGSLHLEALLAVLKEAMNDKYDYIGWWLYEAADYIVSWEEDGKTIERDLTDVNDLYDYIIENRSELSNMNREFTDEFDPISFEDFEKVLNAVPEGDQIEFSELMNYFQNKNGEKPMYLDIQSYIKHAKWSSISLNKITDKDGKAISNIDDFLKFQLFWMLCIYESNHKNQHLIQSQQA